MRPGELFFVSIPMPFVGESILDGVLLHWLVKPGDKVGKGKILAEIETEKSTWEFESPCDGEVVKLHAEEGDVIEVGKPIIDLKTADSAMTHMMDQKKTEKTPALGARTPAEPAPERGSAQRLSPGVKKLMRDHHITETELPLIKGSGKESRINAEDIIKYAKERGGGAPGIVQAKRPCNLAAIGTFVPDRIVKNDAFAGRFEDINENYIQKVTGIEERRYIDDDQTTSDMAVEAGRKALEYAEINPDRLDLIIVATSTPDLPLPACACAVQQKLHAKAVPAFDLSAACSGWLYGLSVAREFIENGSMKNILVIGAETMSRFTNPLDKATAFLFGDGAGAAVVSSELKGHALSRVHMETDGTLYDIILRRGGGASYPVQGNKKIFVEDFWFTMDGHRMFREAVASFRTIINLVLRKEKTALDEFKWIVPHQANRRILKAVAHEVGIPVDKIFSNIQSYGNTSAASIPLALKELEMRDLVGYGDKLLLCSVGAGVTTAGCVVTW